MNFVSQSRVKKRLKLSWLVWTRTLLCHVLCSSAFYLEECALFGRSHHTKAVSPSCFFIIAAAMTYAEMPTFVNHLCQALATHSGAAGSQTSPAPDTIIQWRDTLGRVASRLPNSCENHPGLNRGRVQYKQSFLSPLSNTFLYFLSLGI